jgi:glucosylceramidase
VTVFTLAFRVSFSLMLVIPYIQAAKQIQPNLRISASPWSPPTWMKRPAVFNHGTFIMEPAYLDAYALYFLKFVQAYEAEGLPIAQVHV